MELGKVLFIFSNIAKDKQNLRLQCFRQAFEWTAQFLRLGVRLDRLHCSPRRPVCQSQILHHPLLLSFILFDLQLLQSARCAEMLLQKAADKARPVVAILCVDRQNLGSSRLALNCLGV